MAFIVTDACVRCKFTDCVAVCPVDCFKEGVNMLVIDPGECIDCGACVPACPVTAIYLEDEVPDEQREYIELNARFSKTWPTITTQKKPLPEAEQYRTVSPKRQLIIEKGG